MADESVEKRLAQLENELERLKAVKEINDLMAKYEYYHCSGMFPEHADLFAKRDDSIAQVGTWGFYKGWDSIHRLYAGVHMARGDAGPGFLMEHHLTTPLVEVAGDGKTAKGVWMSPGHETNPDRKTGEIRATWCWVKYGCDFIKEDGRWKIWHLFVFLTLWADFYKSWAEGGEHPAAAKADEVPPEHRPDAPSILTHQPYDPNKPREFCPAFPEPYETYDEKEGVYWMDPKPKRKPAYLPYESKK